MAYAAIHVPEFPLLSWQRQEKSARSQALAVVEGKPPTERVISFNRAARDLGLRHGMSKVQADTFGQVHFHERSILEERASLEVFFAFAKRFSPRVQIISSPMNDYSAKKQLAAVLLLDQSGTEGLFGNGRSYADRIREALSQPEFAVDVAVAPNAEASLILARSFSGVTHVDKTDVQSTLAPLPLDALNVGSALLATLSRWGIRNLGELAALPEAALISRVGQQAKRLQRLAIGVEDHLLIPENPKFGLSEHAELDTALESLESLLFIMSPMLETLLRQAIHHGYALRSLTVTLGQEKSAPHLAEIRPAVPVQSRDLLLKLLHLKLQADPPQSGILAVTLTGEPAIPQVAQRGLFQTQFPDPDKLDLLIARLKGIVGEKNVGSPLISNSFCDDEFGLGPYRPGTGGPAQPTLPRSALRRFRPIQEARVVCHDEGPAYLFWKGECLELGPVAGPWQSSGYWWDGRRWQVDEWDAIVFQPRQSLRLRHDVELGAWYVAGQYD